MFSSKVDRALRRQSRCTGAVRVWCSGCGSRTRNPLGPVRQEPAHPQDAYAADSSRADNVGRSHTRQSEDAVQRQEKHHSEGEPREISQEDEACFSLSAEDDVIGRG